MNKTKWETHQESIAATVYKMTRGRSRPSKYSAGPRVDKTFFRNLAIAQLKRDGKTLQEIANTYNVSRERVRQVLLKTGEEFPNQRTKRNPANYITFNCTECGTEGQKNKSHTIDHRSGKVKKKLFCNRACFQAYISKHRQTWEDKMEYNRRKSREWHRDVYRAHPHYKEMVARRNRGENLSIHDYDAKA